MILKTRNLKVSYGNKIILKNINLNIKKGEIVTIVGPNGSGKSTLIKALSRCLKPKEGNILLNGKNIKKISTKEIAKEIAILPQNKNIPSDITVGNLVSYGRYPHLKFGKRLGKKDKKIIDWAIKKTNLNNLKERFISDLSGGEKQRAWIAIALAQKPNILMLDEPTTYLDISYQIEILELIKQLNNLFGITIIMVLHDLNHATRYSDSIYVLKEGQIYKHGSPEDVLNKKLLKEIFKINAHIYKDKINNCPYFIANKVN